MSVRNFFGLISLLAILSPLSASAIKCISSADEFKEQASELPKPFDNLPLMLAIEKFGAKAAIQVRVAGSKLKLESFVSNPFASGPDSLYISEEYIQKVCFDGTKVSVVMENTSGKVPQVVLVDEDTVKVDGNKFDKCTSAKFQKIAGAVQSQVQSQKPGSSNKNQPQVEGAGAQ